MSIYIFEETTSLYYLFMLCILNRSTKISIIMFLLFSASLKNSSIQTGYGGQAKLDMVNSAVCSSCQQAPFSDWNVVMDGFSSYNRERIQCEKPKLTLKGCHIVSLVAAQIVKVSFFSLIIQSSHLVFICQHSWHVIHVII